MGSKVTIKLNDAGVKELLMSDEVQEACVAAADATAAATGSPSDYEVSYHRTKVRAGAIVETATRKAYKNRNALLKAVGSIIPAKKIDRYGK